jgi:hypothetical protein
MRGQSFRLSTARAAILDGTHTVMVPAGAIVVVVSDPDSRALIYVLHDGRKIQMFERDIRQQGTAVVSEPSPKNAQQLASDHKAPSPSPL